MSVNGAAAEQVSVQLDAEVLLHQGRRVVMRGHAGNRRLLVVADPRMSRAKIAAELRDLADRLERVSGHR